MGDLRQRVPGHSLIDELLRQWDLGTIHVDQTTRAVVIDDEAVSWYRGVLGEREVAFKLDLLGNEWTVLHSVPVGRGETDIDHIAISQAGVFTINTKFSPGKRVWVAGRGMYVGDYKQPHVLNALREARRASERLSRAARLTVPVTALIVFVNPDHITEKARPGGGPDDPEVRVIRHRDLVSTLLGRPVFSTEQVTAIVNAAVQPATWHESPAVSSAGEHITREFEALEEALGPELAEPLVKAARVEGLMAESGAPRRQRPIRSPRVYAPRKRAARSPRASGSRPSRKRASAFEKLIGSLVMPVVGLIFLYTWMNSLTGK